VSVEFIRDFSLSLARQLGDVPTTHMANIDIARRVAGEALPLVRVVGKARALLPLRRRAVLSGLLRVRRTGAKLASRRLPAPLAFAVEELIGRLGPSSKYT
jgi:hypothetical protein